MARTERQKTVHKATLVGKDANLDSLALGPGDVTGDASAALDVVSTSSGLGVPSMTGTQRDAITTPRDGLLIYNSTTHKLNVRANGSWVAVH
jgi:hypothetical protein